MNKILTITFISVISILLLIPINTLAQYPESDKYEYLGIRHDVRPQVCLFEPNPTNVDWDVDTLFAGECFQLQPI